MNLIPSPEVRDFDVSYQNRILGTIEDMYLSSDNWNLQYVVMNTGSWLLGRRILIAPDQVDHWDVVNHLMVTHLEPSEAEFAPSAQAAFPLSVEDERLLAEAVHSEGSRQNHIQLDDGLGNPILASAPFPPHGVENGSLHPIRTLTDLPVLALDQKIGHVQGLLLDVDAFLVPYLSINLGSWFAPDLVAVPTRLASVVLGRGAHIALEAPASQIDETPRVPPEQLGARGDAELVRHYRDAETPQVACATH